jgi:hypothetical protein
VDDWLILHSIFIIVSVFPRCRLDHVFKFQLCLCITCTARRRSPYIERLEIRYRLIAVSKRKLVVLDFFFLIYICVANRPGKTRIEGFMIWFYVVLSRSLLEKVVNTRNYHCLRWALCLALSILCHVHIFLRQHIAEGTFICLKLFNSMIKVNVWRRRVYHVGKCNLVVRLQLLKLLNISC